MNRIKSVQIYFALPCGMQGFEVKLKRDCLLCLPSRQGKAPLLIWRTKKEDGTFRPIKIYEKNEMA